MNMKPLFVSYYTPDYKERARALLRSMRKLDLDFDVRPIEEKGSWQKDSQYKAKFMWDMLIENFDRNKGVGRPLVWVDADAEILNYPAQFFRGGTDFAAVEWRHPNIDKTELLSGTLYFANNVKCHRLVDAWVEECIAKPDDWDQRCLRRALNRFADDGLKITFLPVTYCFIFDIHRQIYPQVDPIICHYQASREAKLRKP